MKPQHKKMTDLEIKMLKGLQLSSKKIIKDAKKRGEQLVVMRKNKIKRIKF